MLPSADLMDALMRQPKERSRIPHAYLEPFTQNANGGRPRGAHSGLFALCTRACDLELRYRSANVARQSHIAGELRIFRPAYHQSERFPNPPLGFIEAPTL